MALKAKVRAVLRSAGFDVQRTSRTDPWEVIGRLMQGQPAAAILDVGSKDGKALPRYSRAIPDARIFAFEPSPVMFEQLVSACAALPSAEAVPLALAREPGTMTLRENSDPSLTSLLHPGGTAWGEVVNERDVRVETVDGFCRDRGIDRVSVLAVDAQGYDFEVLQGAASMMGSGRIDIVLTEMEFLPMYEGAVRFDEIFKFVLDQDYQLVDFFDIGYTADGRASWGDALFMRPEVQRGG